MLVLVKLRHHLVVNAACVVADRVVGGDGNGRGRSERSGLIDRIAFVVVEAMRVVERKAGGGSGEGVGGLAMVMALAVGLRKILTVLGRPFHSARNCLVSVGAGAAEVRGVRKASPRTKSRRDSERRRVRTQTNEWRTGLRDRRGDKGSGRGVQSRFLIRESTTGFRSRITLLVLAIGRGAITDHRAVNGRSRVRDRHNEGVGLETKDGNRCRRCRHRRGGGGEEEGWLRKRRTG